MSRQLIGMPQFCILELYRAFRMLRMYSRRCNLGWSIALDHFGAFVSSPLYQGRGVLQHTGHP